MAGPPASLPDPVATRTAGYRWSRDRVGESGASVHRLHGRGDAPDLYLKHGRGALARDLADEAARLRWLSGRLPVPQLLDFHRQDDAAWLLVTALPGRTAFQLIETDPANAPAIVDALAAFLLRLHALPVADCPFEAGHTARLAAARVRLEAGLVDTADFDEARQGWTAPQVWAAMSDLLPFTPERVVTHGDFMLDNLLIEDGAVSGCIDLGRLGLADRYQDLALLWNSLGAFGPVLQHRLFERYGIAAPDPRRLDFHLMLDEFF